MRPPVLRLHDDEMIVDCFAGGGGASLGIEMALGRSPDVAVNHDDEAIAMHAANHPNTRHLVGDVWDVNPREVTGGRRVGLAWFSPDCTHHSKAKNGKPNRDKAVKSRALAWVVIRWAREVKPRVILLENVEEFENWGPLDNAGKPVKALRGRTFRFWLGKLKAAGYQVEMRQLRAHDYGAPTIRKRLFVIARCDGQPIVWPEPTHGPGRPHPHRVAAECIDWSQPVLSIFASKAGASAFAKRHNLDGVPQRPLAPKTLRRIARGVVRYVIQASTPFVIPTTHQGDLRSHPVTEPLRTITCAKRGELALVAPTLVRSDMHQSNAACTYPADEPLRTITTGGGHALVAPTLIQTGYGERQGQAPRALDIQKPLGTIIAGGTRGCGNGKHALVAAFLAKHYGGHEGNGAPLSAPAATVTTQDHHALVTSNLVKLRGSCADGQRVDAPAPTITARGTHVGEVRAFLTKYYSAGGAMQGQQIDLPLGTVVTHDRFGLVYVHGEPYEIADIGMRMLQPRELFRAQGFPDSFRIDPLVPAKPRKAKTSKARKLEAKKATARGLVPITKTAQIRMCGNSVCPPIAAALVSANLAGHEAAVA